MSSIKPFVLVENGGGMLSSVVYSNGSNGLFVVAPHVSNGYVNHLHEKLAVFETEDFDAQTYVQ